jgi:hypothetical protein
MAELVEVFAAIDAVEQVRRLLDRVDVSDATAQTWARYEVAMLRHWAEALRGRTSDYGALGEGLADFADTCDQMLAVPVCSGG